jgi:cyclopropane-fatty-acyl-phospholipid synthase
MSIIELCERGLVPDALTRYGIRRLCAQRLREEGGDAPGQAQARMEMLLQELRRSPIAIETQAANAQHYELPTRFFQLCLGKRLKYSSGYYPTGAENLDQAEDAMLALYGERAQLADGQRILELGCGWGSLTLWMAERYPGASITAVSNSATQRAHIESACAERGLRNVRVLTRDVNTLELPADSFDRIVSVEMFEHLRNYDSLFERLGRWLADEGRLFVHIFCHRTLMYPFETEGEGNWMGRYFFTGGLMPSADTLLNFQRGLALEERWLLPGTHYERTANHWLQRQDDNRAEVMAVLREAYGKDAARWQQVSRIVRRRRA